MCEDLGVKRREGDIAFLPANGLLNLALHLLALTELPIP